ncbi:hypothetical protein ABZ671_15635 [Micromonospora sp. NPDC006766]|uniref:effector-associated constant component EACC1 n=1 Tax=Micromonospora sp. NPDC006766 TaxID=3154778 RepID=UPI0033C69975
MPNGRIEIVLAPGDDEVGPGDDEWTHDLDLLREGLVERDVDLNEEWAFRSGHKGAVAEIVVVLGGSGAVKALVTVLRSWLADRQTRTMRLTVRGPEPVEIDLQAKGVSDETIREALLDAIERGRRDE